MDILDASIRRFYAPALEGSDLSLAGWAKKLTGATVMAVGSVGLDSALNEQVIVGLPQMSNNLPDLMRRVNEGEFDIVAIGRLHMADPAISQRLRNGEPMPEFDRKLHEGRLY